MIAIAEEYIEEQNQDIELVQNPYIEIAFPVKRIKSHQKFQIIDSSSRRKNPFCLFLRRQVFYYRQTQD